MVLFMVLSEMDDVDDLILEMMKLVFDGYLILLCIFVECGYFLVIDVVCSVSCNLDCFVL